MGNDIVPSDPPSWSDVLEKLNIPKLIAGPAGEAISRLVGHAVDVPSEYVKNFKQGIVDRREARSEVSRALARAAASDVVADKELVQRAAQSFLAKELRAQTNKEAVARKAIEHLSKDDNSKKEQKAQTPEDDWLNLFERYAENASSEKLRDLWARVLAKQVRSPKSFSLRTMRCISEMDFETAKLFEEISCGVVNASFVLRPNRLEGKTLARFLMLEDAGLVTGSDGTLGQIVKSKEPARFVYKLPATAVKVTTFKPINLQLPAILLTTMGREIFKIMSPPDDLDPARILAEKFLSTDSVSRIEYGKMNEEQTEIPNAILVHPKPLDGSVASGAIAKSDPPDQGAE